MFEQVDTKILNIDKGGIRTLAPFGTRNFEIRTLTWRHNQLGHLAIIKLVLQLIIYDSLLQRNKFPR